MENEGPIIYVLDQDDLVRDSLRVLLESHGRRVRAFSHLCPLVQSAIKESPACLIIGLHRTLMEGVDLTQHLRARGLDMPIIFAVNSADEAAKRLLRRSGAAAILDKPLQEAALLRAIDATLTLPQKGSSAAVHPLLPT